MHIYNLATLLAWLPFGHHLDHAHGFFITAVADSLLDLNFTNRTVAPHYEGNEYLALGLAFNSALGVLEVFQDELSKPGPTARKFRKSESRGMAKRSISAVPWVWICSMLHRLSWMVLN